MNLRNQFIQWYFNEFREDRLYEKMSNTVENSPWHRERNIGVHTDMVVAQYLSRSGDDQCPWMLEDLTGAFAAAFHDVGKPAAMVEKHRADRGTYFAFHGHEKTSARLWEDWAVRNWRRLVRFGMFPQDIYAIGWMIENHLPWDIKKKDKVEQLVLTAQAVAFASTFTDLLMSDTCGRISDDAEEKIAKSNKWVDEFLAQTKGPHLSHRDNDQPALIMPIAPSGAGKSTFVREKAKMINNYRPFVHYSWDNLRHEWYGDDYALAYLRSTEDKDFRKKVNAEFTTIIKAKDDVLVDNINSSKKSRRSFLAEAKRHGYYTIAVLLPVDLDTIIDRQTTRDDKSVPASAVRRQYMSMQYPSSGEFDKIRVMDSNLT